MLPVYNFTKEHIPEPFRKVDEVFELAESIAFLSVCLRVIYSCDKNVGNTLKASNDYPEYKGKVKGNNILSITTGRVCDVEANTGSNCFCGKCIDSKNPSRVWWSVKVFSNEHRSHDNKEVIEITCFLFLDDKKADKSVRLVGGRKIYTLVDGTYCSFETATCDEALASELHAEVQKFKVNWQLLYSMYEHNTNPEKLVIVISHPHGEKKRILIGLAVDIGREMNLGYSKLSYLQPTCICLNREPTYILGYNLQGTANLNGGPTNDEIICKCMLCKYKKNWDAYGTTSNYSSHASNSSLEDGIRKRKQIQEKLHQSDPSSKQAILWDKLSEENDENVSDAQMTSNFEDKSDDVHQPTSMPRHTTGSNLGHQDQPSHIKTKPESKRSLTNPPNTKNDTLLEDGILETKQIKEELQKSGHSSKQTIVRREKSSEERAETLYDDKKTTNLKDISDDAFLSVPRHTPGSDILYQDQPSHQKAKAISDSYPEVSLRKNQFAVLNSSSDPNASHSPPTRSNYKSTMDFETDSLFHLIVRKRMRSKSFDFTAASSAPHSTLHLKKNNSV